MDDDSRDSVVDADQHSTPAEPSVFDEKGFESDRKLLARFRGCHPVQAVLATVAAATAARIVVLPIAYIATGISGQWHALPLRNAGPFRMAAEALVIAPVLETLVGQALVFGIGRKLELLPHRAPLVIIASALWFGGLHVYSAGYIIFASAIGFVLAAAFWLRGCGRRSGLSHRRTPRSTP